MDERQTRWTEVGGSWCLRILWCKGRSMRLYTSILSYIQPIFFFRPMISGIWCVHCQLETGYRFWTCPNWPEKLPLCIFQVNAHCRCCQPSGVKGWMNMTQIAMYLKIYIIIYDNIWQYQWDTGEDNPLDQIGVAASERVVVWQVVCPCVWLVVWRSSTSDDVFPHWGSGRWRLSAPSVMILTHFWALFGVWW